jgi:hypothetical protein
VDPRYASNLVPPTPYSPPDLSESDQLALVTAIQNVMREIDDKEQQGKDRTNEQDNSSSERSSQSIPLIPDWTLAAATATSSSGNEQKENSKEDASGGEGSDGDANLKTSGEEEDEEGEEVREQEILDEDFSKEKLLGGRWHWSSLPISSVYELTLLRWETGIQKELGNSIINLLKSLQQMVAEVCPSPLSAQSPIYASASRKSFKSPSWLP